MIRGGMFVNFHAERSLFLGLLMFLSSFHNGTSFSSLNPPASSAPAIKSTSPLFQSVATLEVENQTTPALSPQDKSSAFDNNLGLDAPIHNFQSLTDCLSSLESVPETHDESLVVVKYYASYCRICKRASITYKKIATEPAYENLFHFTRVEVGRLSAERLRTLGLTKFPFIQIFRKGMCVASFSTGASHLFARRVRDTLDLCQSRSPADWDEFEREFSEQIKANEMARSTVLHDLQSESLQTN